MPDCVPYAPSPSLNIVILPSNKVWQVVMSSALQPKSEVYRHRGNLISRGLGQATHQATIHSTIAADTSLALQDRKMSCSKKTVKRFPKRQR